VAGAIPLALRRSEGDMIRSLNDRRLCRFLTILDELGWIAARELLPTLADRQQHETTGDNP
jgi:hypothetical protein